MATTWAQESFRKNAYQWREVGKDVAQTLSHSASRMSPTVEDFKAAAKNLGITQSQARTAFNVFMWDNEAPNRLAPTVKG